MTSCTWTQNFFTSHDTSHHTEDLDSYMITLKVNDPHIVSLLHHPLKYGDRLRCCPTTTRMTHTSTSRIPLANHTQHQRSLFTNIRRSRSPSR